MSSSRERVGMQTPTTELKSKIEVWGGMGVDKMDTEVNFHEGKLEIRKEVGLGWLTRVEKIMVLYWGR